MQSLKLKKMWDTHYGGTLITSDLQPAPPDKVFDTAGKFLVHMMLGTSTSNSVKKNYKCCFCLVFLRTPPKWDTHYGHLTITVLTLYRVNSTTIKGKF